MPRVTIASLVITIENLKSERKDLLNERIDLRNEKTRIEKKSSEQFKEILNLRAEVRNLNDNHCHVKSALQGALNSMCLENDPDRDIVSHNEFIPDRPAQKVKDDSQSKFIVWLYKEMVRF